MNEDLTIMQSILDFVWGLFQIEFDFAGLSFSFWDVFVACALIAFVTWLIGSYFSHE